MLSIVAVVRENGAGSRPGNRAAVLKGMVGRKVRAP